LLYRWGALETRAEVLKRLSSSSIDVDASSSSSYYYASRPEAAGVEKEIVVAVRCEACGSAEEGVEPGKGVCKNCKAFAFRCVVCQLAVRGQSMFCLQCSHGGHTPHMYDWFSENDVCASGCGCRCIFGQSEEIKGDGGEGGGVVVPVSGRRGWA